MPDIWDVTLAVAALEAGASVQEWSPRRHEATVRPAYMPPGWGSGWRRYRRTGSGLRRAYAAQAAVVAGWVVVTAAMVWRWG